MLNEQQLQARAKLMLSIQMPDLEECRQEGFDANKEDILEKQNPYALDSEEYYHWQEGWWESSYSPAPEKTVVVELSTRKLLKRALAIGGAILFAMLCFELAEMAF